jgi:trehalose 6-phosphate phosphatase
MSSNPVPLSDDDWALFLDVDGTLLEIAETPQSVHASHSLKQLLEKLEARLEGALALISGRSIENLDQLFAPLRLCASGIHGLERRDALGTFIDPAFDASALAAAHEELDRFVQQHEGLLLEDKRYSLALHFRLAPELADRVHDTMRSVLARLGPQFTLQAGKCVLELRPAAWNKGVAVSAFMQEAPFRGRTPLYIGDDVTDEDAFEVVNALQGQSIRVGGGSDTHAQHHLADVDAVIRWLRDNPPVRDGPTGAPAGSSGSRHMS